MSTEFSRCEDNQRRRNAGGVNTGHLACQAESRWDSVFLSRNQSMVTIVTACGEKFSVPNNTQILTSQSGGKT
ncbi:unnamed protein product [Amoebophrya sp. A120]|nr:unnamed protein product [Amoebophrya sp. A120]|eukprot:GSA120T00016560001.1